MTRAELKSQLEATVDDLMKLMYKLQDLPETQRIVRIATRIEGAIDDLRAARSITTVTTEIDQEP